MRAYLAAFAMVVAALVVRLAFDPLLEDRAPFLFFSLAVLGSAAWFGLRPGIFALGASLLLGSLFFVAPRFALLPLSTEGLTNLVAFAVISGGMIALIELLGRSRLRELDSREALFATETREQRLIDAAQDFAIYELDPEGKILTWNKGAERLKGWKAEEVIGKPYNILHTPESRARNAPGRELKIAAETGRFEEEAPRIRKDGTIFAAHVSLFPLREGNGDITGYVKVTRDISDRSKAGKAILETRRRMEAIVQSAMDAIITIDDELRIVLFNPAAEKMFGYSSEVILGQPVTTLFPEAQRGKHEDLFRALFADGVPNRRFEEEELLVAQRGTGEEFPIEASISQVTVGGERVGTLILRDITERKTNEEARALLAREVDHRAKNALAVAQALVGLTKANSIDEFAEAVRGRIAALGRAHSLLSQSQWQGAPLEQLIRDELRPYAKEGQLVLEGRPISCTAGAVQSLSLLFHELATNAVKHGSLGREHGTVAIKWHLDPQLLTVRWVESGGPTVSPPKGQGFGSKLLREVSVRQLDAEIDFDWRKEGLVVEIRIPASLFVLGEVRDERSDGDSGEAQLGLSGDDRQPRILLVEDEELVALELSVELSRLGWAIVGPAATLAEATELLSCPFDAAVLDVNLRGRSVYPVAEMLSARQVPFVFCTGYEIVDPEGRFPNAPVIRKPAHPAAVSAALSDLLKARMH